MLDPLIVFAQNQRTLFEGMELPLGMLAVFALFYFLVLRPLNRRQEQERLALLNNLKKNDKVLITPGIYATVVAVSDKEDEVTVKVDDNVRLKVLKSTIGRNLTNEEAARAAKAAGQAAKDVKKEGVA